MKDLLKEEWEKHKASKNKPKIIKEINIPEQIRGFNFVLDGGNGKQPIEKAWQKKVHKIDCPKFQEHISQGKNYGVQSNESFININGENRFLIVIDFDTKEFQDKVLKEFPETFTTSSGSDKNCFHLWLASDENKAFKIKDEKLETLSDVIGAGNQIIGPGSTHQSGSIYSVVKDVPIVFMPYAEIKAILKPHDKSPKKIKKPQKQYSPKGIGTNIAEDIINSISMDEVLNEIGIDTSKNPTNCFAHGSKGEKCFSYNDQTAHCFHCDGSWNKFSLIREAKNLTDKDTFNWFAEKTGKTDELEKSRKDYGKENAQKNKLKEAARVFTLGGQIELFYDQQPFFYDKSKMFFIWNKELFKWELSDEIDILNVIFALTGKDIITSKSRAEIINSLKQKGRLNHPKPIKKSWIQFKNKIYDVKTGEEFEATPEYFVTNPIPWKVGDSEDTPIIDKYLNEWVGETYSQLLYEFLAYNTCIDKFMQRIFAFCGGGSNGKGTFIKLNYKFLGEDNCVSSEIKNLSDDKFEAAVLYRKLLCVMGEVSHSDLKNTNQIKKIAGEDKLSFQFKGKTPFTDDNTATCVCLTNSLPITPDKSLGFYRKWGIIDFPNQFSGIKHDVVGSIPDVEFENLARKCINILKDLYKTRKFTNEGTFEERMERYEERSNPVMKYLEEYYDEEVGGYISIRQFTNDCNEYLKKNHLRIMSAVYVGKILREEGFSVSQRKIDDITSTVILNLSKKVRRTTETTQISTRNSPVKSSENLDGFDGLSGFTSEEIKNAGYTKEELKKAMKDK